MAKWYTDTDSSQISKRDYNTRCLIESVLGEFTREMEGYSYFGSNPGIPEDDFDDVAEAIMTKLNLWLDNK